MQVSLAALDGEDAEMPPVPYIARTVSLNGASAQPMVAQEGTASYAAACNDNENYAKLTHFPSHFYAYNSNRVSHTWVCRPHQQHGLLLVLGIGQSCGVQSLPTMLLLQLLQVAA